jgi:hypothetical protein
MAESHELYYANATIGGTAGCLDYEPQANLANNDAAIVIDDANDRVLFYHYDSASAAAESDPDVVEPDDQAGGVGAWLLCHIAPYNCEAFEGFQNTAGANIIEFSTDGSLGGNSDTVVPTEQAVKEYGDSGDYLGGDKIIIESEVPGFLMRPQFIWKDADELYIEPGVYHINGTTSGETVVRIDATLTFQVGSGGSNAASTDFTAGAATWHYLYLDDSATLSGALAATDFLNNTTRPTYSHAKGGFYNGQDRCVFVILETAAGNLSWFGHDGGDLVNYVPGDMGGTRWTQNQAANQAWTDSEDNHPTPKLHTTNFWHVYYSLDETGGGASLFEWRKNGTTSSGHTIGRVANDQTKTTPSGLIVTDNDGLCEFYNGDPASNNMDCDICGIYLPKGM